MKAVKVLNTPKNKEKLKLVGASFTETKRFLTVQPSSYHQSWLRAGKITVAGYKKNVLGM